ncbi:hypothetical protein LMCDFJHI_00879 [Aeromonas salmonicida]
MQKTVAEHSRGDGQQKQQHYAPGPPLQIDILTGGIGHMTRHHQTHQQGWHQKIEQGRNEQGEKLAKLHLASLPHHQGGDVAKGAEGTAGIGRDHDIDAGKIDEASIPVGDFQHNGAHQECSGEVVGHRRDAKCQPPRQPEQGSQLKAGPDKPGPERIEQISVFHGVDVGHRHQQKQHQLGIFEQGVAKCLLCGRAHAILRVGNPDQDPDHAGGHQHGF